LSARSAEQAKKEQFHLVICMVGKSDGPDAARAGRTRQEFVPQPAGRHFERKFLLVRDPSNVRLPDNAREPQVLRGGTDQTLVCVTAPPAQLMIEMSHRQAPLVRRRQTLKQLQQNNGIQAS
jgi:hypothetical protein